MERTRFKDALWYNKQPNIIIGGAGGIGSWMTYFVCKANYPVTVYDYDTVEAHNLGGQLFLADSIGKLKVEALADMICEFNDVNHQLFIKNEKITENTNYNVSHYRAPTIFISCFDNMEARKAFFNGFVRFNDSPIKYFIDGRLLMEQMRIYCIQNTNMNQIENYVLEHLFDDSEVDDLPCSMKQTSHSAAMIASHMMGFLTNIITNVYNFNNEQMFKVPYMWDYVIPNNLITEKYLE